MKRSLRFARQVDKFCPALALEHDFHVRNLNEIAMHQPGYEALV
jgi:hypothetical protein